MRATRKQRQNKAVRTAWRKQR